jgi:aryl-alcohol dehydrogenase-like predicted oxidoreductase
MLFMKLLISRPKARYREKARHAAHVPVRGGAPPPQNLGHRTAHSADPDRCNSARASYSILNRWIERDLLATLEELGVGRIAFLPLAQGMLTNRYLNGLPQNARATCDGSLSQSSRIRTSPPFVP